MNDSIYYSEVDSKRFKKNIFRGTLETIDIDSLKNCIKENKPDMLILRVPVDTKTEHHKLSVLGKQVLHADTLIYYFAPLRKIEQFELRNNIQFELINSTNSSILTEIIPIIFNGYSNHYSSNPFLDTSSMIEGYVEWAKSYITTESDNKISWLVKKDSEVIGFANCTFNSEKKECEGVLYGVMPEYSGRGVYTDIIKFTQEYFKKIGMNTMWVSTQIQNFNVQKSWIGQHFQLKKAFDTYHIMI